MKKGIVLLAAVLVLSWLGSGATQAQENVIKLKYAHFMPSPTKQAQLADQWCKEVEKRTNGRVKITFYPSQTLMPAPQTWDSLQKGIGDIGFSIFSYTRGRFPLTEVTDLPLGIRSGYAATKMINAFHKKFKPKEMDDLQIMYLHGHGPGLFLSKKPVTKLEELKGMKVRSTGLSAKVTQALGAAPVGIPIAETYDALMKGVVEATLVPVEALQQWKLAEVTKYTTENWGTAYTTAFFVAMNKSKWESLPKDIQATIEKINEEWIEKTGRAWDEVDIAGRKFGEKAGVKTISLTREENARWAVLMKPILDEYVKNTKAKGLPGDEALKFCVDYLKKNQK
jgi:TRAP-type C4-dicarboxylate transport system substrate-binding protein